VRSPGRSSSRSRGAPRRRVRRDGSASAVRADVRVVRRRPSASSVSSASADSRSSAPGPHASRVPTQTDFRVRVARSRRSRSGSARGTRAVRDARHAATMGGEAATSRPRAVARSRSRRASSAPADFGFVRKRRLPIVGARTARVPRAYTNRLPCPRRALPPNSVRVGTRDACGPGRPPRRNDGRRGRDVATSRGRAVGERRRRRRTSGSSASADSRSSAPGRTRPACLHKPTSVFASRAPAEVGPGWHAGRVRSGTPATPQRWAARPRRRDLARSRGRGVGERRRRRRTSGSSASADSRSSAPGPHASRVPTQTDFRVRVARSRRSRSGLARGTRAVRGAPLA
jgi:hypothetical protein